MAIQLISAPSFSDAVNNRLENELNSVAQADHNRHLKVKVEFITSGTALALAGTLAEATTRVAIITGICRVILVLASTIVGAAIGATIGYSLNFLSSLSWAPISLPSVSMRAAASVGAFLLGSTGAHYRAKHSYERVSNLEFDYRYQTDRVRDFGAWKDQSLKASELVRKFFSNDEFFDGMICPITLDVMIYPVETPRKRYYEYSAIARHIRNHPGESCPLRSERLSLTDLTLSMEKVNEISEKIIFLVSQFSQKNKKAAKAAYNSQLIKKLKFLARDLLSLRGTPLVSSKNALAAPANRDLPEFDNQEKEVLFAVFQPVMRALGRTHDHLYHHLSTETRNRRQRQEITIEQEIHELKAIIEWYITNRKAYQQLAKVG